MDKTIVIPRHVYNGITAVQDSGKVDMHDYQQVMAAAQQAGYHDTVEWLHNNVKIYAQGVLYGMEPENEDYEG